jgi:TonB-linked SusC/RagA family outer membrane protein
MQNLYCKSILFVTFCLLLTISFSAWAQTTVKGTVTDAATNEGLPGVAVLVKPGNTGGTITDFDGNYEIRVPSDASLQFSYVGYRTQVIAVNNQTAINVQLVEDVAKLDEVVVTGLATNVKRSNLANAVATLSAKELTGVTPPQTLQNGLSGKIPGANLVANSGAPGGGISMKLRGVTTVLGSSQPLFVVDGVIMDNSSTSGGLNAVTAAAAGGNASTQDNASNRIADLNPDDIESIEVLKGASAAAIYGSLAASGVVIISTKRGSAGRTNINLSQDIGVAMANKLLGVRDLSGLDTAQISAQWGKNAVADFLAAKNGGGFTDYEKEMYGNTGLLRNTRLSLSAGGHDRTTFYLAGNLKNEEGIIKNTGYDYKSLRANVDHRIGDRITISLSNGFSNSSADRGLTNNDNNGVTFGVALSSTPSFANLFPDDKGNYPRNPYAASNPLETRDLMTNNETTNRYTGSLTINAILYETAKTYTKLVLRGGLDYYNLKTNAQFPRILQFQEKGLGGLSVQGFVNNTNVNTAAYLVNNFAASEKLNLVTSLGTTYESFNFDNVLATASDLIIGQTNIDQAGSVSVSQTRTKQLGNGLFAQEEVNYADMVVATVGVRFDKSTVNGDVNKFYAYPKASVALNITKMPFWASEDVQQLKLRLAYGEAGNFPPYIAKFTTLGPANISGLPGLQIGTTLGNANIAPERQKELEAGFDVAFLQNRLGLEFTYYQKTCSDLILRRNMPLSSGFGTEIGNFGELVNNGFEIKLNTLPVKTENVRWSSTVTFWRNTSEITELLVPAFNLGGFGNTLGTFKIEEGKPATQIVGRFVNSAGESVVEAIGDAEPDFQMGFAQRTDN